MKRAAVVINISACLTKEASSDYIIQNSLELHVILKVHEDHHLVQLQMYLFKELISICKEDTI